MGWLDDPVGELTGGRVNMPFRPLAGWGSQGLKSPGGGGGGKKAGGGGGKRNKQAAAPDPAISYIQSLSPGMTPKQAQSIFKRYNAETANPGLSAFVRRQTNQQDPLAFQAFYNQTVAPYLKGLTSDYNATQDAMGTAMEGALGNQMPSAERDVLKRFLPMIQASGKQQGLSLGAAAAAGPAFDQLVQQLQNTLASNRQTQYALENPPVAAAGATDPATTQMLAKLFSNS